VYVPSYRKILKRSWDPPLKGRKLHLKVGGHVNLIMGW